MEWLGVVSEVPVRPDECHRWDGPMARTLFGVQAVRRPPSAACGRVVWALGGAAALAGRGVGVGGERSWTRSRFRGTCHHASKWTPDISAEGGPCDTTVCAGVRAGVCATDGWDIATASILFGRRLPLRSKPMKEICCE